MKDPRRRWLWLLLPILLIVALFAAAPQDNFAEYARKGIPFDPQAVPSLINDSPSIESSGLLLSSGGRQRAWALPDDIDAVCRRLQERGLIQGRSGSTSSFTNGTPPFNMEFRQVGANEIDTQVVVVEGTKVPKGFGCVVLVKEPTGLRPAWRRFVARLHGFSKP